MASNKKPRKITRFASLLLLIVFNPTSVMSDQNNANKIQKCCPEYEGLVVNSRLENSNNIFSCSGDISNKNVTVIEIPLVVHAGKGGLEVGFLSCDVDLEGKTSDRNDWQLIWPKSCVDKVLASTASEDIVETVVGSLAVVGCPTTLTLTHASKTEGAPLFSLHKCCPLTHAFDRNTHSCVNSTGPTWESERWLTDILGPEAALVDLKIGRPHCQEAVVEFPGDQYKIALQGSELTVQADSGPAHILPADSFCIDKVASGGATLIARACQTEHSACTDRTCVQKCCPDGEIFVGLDECNEYPICTPSHTAYSFHPEFHQLTGDEGVHSEPDIADKADFGIVFGDKCRNGLYVLNPDDRKSDRHFLHHHTGHLMVPNFKDKKWYSRDSYCLEEIRDDCNNLTGIYAFLCFAEHDPEMAGPSTQMLRSYGICLIISCVFLAATMVVYLTLPQLLNLHGRTLLAHVTCLLAAFAMLAAIDLQTIVTQPACSVLGYLIYFFFLAAFSWLNIMCFDIWWTFRTVRSSHHGLRQERERRRFLFYALYAMGTPLMMTSFVVAVDLLQLYGQGSRFAPAIGDIKCFFSNPYGKWLHFVLPVGLQSIVNVTLFVLTTLHCSRVKAEIHRMQSDNEARKRFHADKAKLMMNVKLFIVMGVSWLLEFLSATLGNRLSHELWYFADWFNSLQGVPIFCIFVLKDKVLRAMQHKLGIKSRRGQNRGTTATGTTSMDSLNNHRIHNRVTGSTTTLSVHKVTHE